MEELRIIIGNDGNVRTLYNEKLDLSELGIVRNERASFVEPICGTTKWQADLSPSNGPVLGPFETRTEAITKEIEWLFENNIPLRE